MKTFMKVNGMKVKEMGMESSQRGMEIILRVIGSMIKEKDKAVTIIMIKINYLLENGLMINLRQEYIQRLRTMRMKKGIKKHTLPTV